MWALCEEDSFSFIKSGLGSVFSHLRPVSGCPGREKSSCLGVDLAFLNPGPVATDYIYCVYAKTTMP